MDYESVFLESYLRLMRNQGVGQNCQITFNIAILMAMKKDILRIENPLAARLHARSTRIKPLKHI